MNAAEITDKLGLHSLRQRAWVSPSVEYTLLLPQQRLTKNPSTSNPPAPLPETVSTRVWNG